MRINININILYGKNKKYSENCPNWTLNKNGILYKPN